MPVWYELPCKIKSTALTYNAINQLWNVGPQSYIKTLHSRASLPSCEGTELTYPIALNHYNFGNSGGESAIISVLWISHTSCKETLVKQNFIFKIQMPN